MKSIKEGGWVPFDERVVKHIPRDKKWTWRDAYMCLQVDYYNGRLLSISSYATQWKWTRKRVKDFIEGLLSKEGWTPPSVGRKQNLNYRQENAQGIRLYNRGLDKNTDQTPVKIPSELPTTSIRKEEKNNTYASGDWQYDLAVLHSECRSETAPPRILQKQKDDQYQSWADELDRINRIDGVEVGVIRRLIEWSAKDDFWRDNSVSLSSWRKKSKSNDLMKHENIANAMNRPNTNGKYNQPEPVRQSDRRNFSREVLKDVEYEGLD